MSHSLTDQLVLQWWFSVIFAGPHFCLRDTTHMFWSHFSKFLENFQNMIWIALLRAVENIPLAYLLLQVTLFASFEAPFTTLLSLEQIQPHPVAGKDVLHLGGAHKNTPCLFWLAPLSKSWNEVPEYPQIIICCHLVYFFVRMARNTFQTINESF